MSGTNGEATRDVERQWGWRAAGALLLVVGVAASLVGSARWGAVVRGQQADAFTARAKDVTATLANVVRRDVDVTDGAKTLVSVGPAVDDAEFQQWFTQEEASGRYPGIEMFGYSKVVAAADAPAALAAATRHAEAYFQQQTGELTPAVAQVIAALYSPTLLDPRKPSYCLSADEAGNVTNLLAAVGKEILATPDLCATSLGPWMDLARRTGQTTATGSGVPNGIMLFSAVYRGGVTPTTEAGRAAAFAGDMGVVVDGAAVLRAAGANTNLGLRLWRIQPGLPDQLLAAAGSAPPRAEQRAIAFEADGSWRLEVTGAPAGGVSARTQALGVLAGGLLVIGLLFAMLWVLARSRDRALRLVEKRTWDLARSEERFRSLASASPVGILQTDAGGAFSYGNHRLAEILGCDAHALVDRGWLDAFDCDDSARILALLGAGEEAGKKGVEARLSGRAEWVRFCAGTLSERGKLTGYVSSLEDVTAQHLIKERLQHESRHDSLTGLPNRLAFLERLQAVVADQDRSSAPSAVLFIDLDRFKQVNDALGHNAGDELLALTAARLGACLRDGDLIARLGGDEFAVLLPGAGSDTAVSVIGRMQAAVGEPFAVAESEVSIGASIGLVMIDDPDEDPASILQDADMAMYRAKKGSSRFEIYNHAMRDSTLIRVETERALRAAINNHEVVVAYQPMVDLATGRITCAEALVRWAHPTRGLLLPAEFLPLAESTGLIGPIGDLVVRDAVETAALLPDDVDVSINVSAHQLATSSLLHDLPRLLDDSGVRRGRFWLEVLETHLLDDRNVDIVRHLRAGGLRVAIDDFGTGYGSLLYLKRLPVDVIKIDRTFVAGLDNNLADRSIVTKVIELAHELGVSVVAEGVETAAQFEMLRAAGADQAQGFLWSPAVPARDLLALVRQLGGAVAASTR